MKKNVLVGFMFIMCALFGFNNYGTAQEFVQNSVVITYSGLAYESPVYSARPTPVRNFLNGVGQAVQNAVQPQYLPGVATTYGATYAAPQSMYQQVTETRFKKVCRGQAGCTYEPYTVTYMKRI